jgi:hypothetical protein
MDPRIRTPEDVASSLASGLEKGTIRLTGEPMVVQNTTDRLFETAKSFVEYLPLVVIIWLGVLLGLSISETYLLTMALIGMLCMSHCIRAVRHYDQSITACVEFKNLSYVNRDDVLYRTYDLILFRLLRERMICSIYTACVIIMCISTESCYLAYITEHFLMRHVVALDLYTLRFAISASGICAIMLSMMCVWATTKRSKELKITWFIKQLNRES